MSTVFNQTLKYFRRSQIIRSYDARTLKNLAENIEFGLKYLSCTNLDLKNLEIPIMRLRHMRIRLFVQFFYPAQGFKFRNLFANPETLRRTFQRFGSRTSEPYTSELTNLSIDNYLFYKVTLQGDFDNMLNCLSFYPNRKLDDLMDHPGQVPLIAVSLIDKALFSGSSNSNIPNISGVFDIIPKILIRF